MPFIFEEMPKRTYIFEDPEPVSFRQDRPRTWLEGVRDYLGIGIKPKTTPLDIEAVETGVSPYRIREEVFGTGRMEEFGRVIGKFNSGLTGGVTDLIKGYEEDPETIVGTLAGSAAHLAGFVLGPAKVAGTLISGSRLAPTIQGLQGVSRVLAQGGATLGLASTLSSVVPSLMRDESFSEAAWDTFKSGAMGTLTGAIYGAVGAVVPAGPALKIPKGERVLSPVQEMAWEAAREPRAVISPLRMALTLAAMDKIRAGTSQWFTIDDVVKGVADGTIDKTELAQRSFDYLMDMYFSTHVPSMKKQVDVLAQRNAILREIAKLSPEAVEKAVDVASKTLPKPRPSRNLPPIEQMHRDRREWQERFDSLSRGEATEGADPQKAAKFLKEGKVRNGDDLQRLVETNYPDDFAPRASLADRIARVTGEKREPAKGAEAPTREALRNEQEDIKSKIEDAQSQIFSDRIEIETARRKAALEGKRRFETKEERKKRRALQEEIQKLQARQKEIESQIGTLAPEPTQERELDIPKVEGAEFVGVQEIPGQPDQYVFNETKTGCTFYAKDLSEAEVKAGADRVRQRFAEAEKKGAAATGEAISDQLPLGAQPGGFQAAVIPGLKEFYERDIVPKSLQLGRDLKDTWQRLKRLAVPRAGVSRDMLDKVMEMKGERDKAEYVLEATTREIEKGFNKMNQQDQVAFIDRMKRGENQPTTELQQTADMMRALDDGLFAEIQKYAPDVRWLEDHYRILWKVLPKPGKRLPRGGGRPFMGLFNRPLEGTEGFLKEHTLEDMTEGIRTGGVPYTYNPMLMFRLHYADAMKYITAQRMWKAFEDLHARVFVKPGDQRPEDFTRLDDRIARVYFPVTGRPAGTAAPEREFIVPAGEWYVERGAARLLNNYLSWDIRRRAWAGGLLWAKNVTTAAELSFSAFHAVFETIETAASGVGLGMKRIWNQGLIEKNTEAIKEGFKDIMTSPATPFTTARIGGDVIKYIGSKEEFLRTTRGQDFIKRFPEADALVNDLFLAGGKLAMHQDYKIDSIRTFRTELGENNYIGAAIRGIPALNELMMKPLFETYIPRLKIGMFLKEYSQVLVERQADIQSGKLTKAEAARTVWDFVENRLGEMNFDNLFWDRTFKTALQLAIRSVTWKLGNIRSFGNAAIRQSEEFYNAYTERRIPRLEQEMAWVVGMAATTAAISTIIQYMSTGKMPEEAKDFIYPKIDNEGNRVTLPTYARDLFTLVHSPLGYVWHSVSGMWGRAIDAWQNKDFYGVQVHNPEENWALQQVDNLIHLMPTPFGISSTLRLRDEGVPAQKQALSFLGFTKAPFYIELSPAEQKAGELVQQYMIAKPRTPEEFERTRLVKKYSREILRALKEGTPIDPHVNSIASDLQAGKLLERDVDRIGARMREPIVGKTKRLPLADAFLVWDLANDEEKEKLKPIMADKIVRAPDDTLRAVQPKVLGFLKELEAVGGGK